jgi:hypothetical protein
MLVALFIVPGRSALQSCISTVIATGRLADGFSICPSLGSARPGSAGKSKSANKERHRIIVIVSDTKGVSQLAR